MSAPEDFEYAAADSLLSALIRDHAHRRYGSAAAFAKKLDLDPNTISTWVRGERDPLRSAAINELSKDLGISVESMKLLGGISVAEACDMVIQNSPKFED